MRSFGQVNDSYTAVGKVHAVGIAKAAGDFPVGERLDITHPIPIVSLMEEPIIEVASSSLHSLALSKDGKIWSWGCNKYGALGRQDGSGNPAPIEHVSIKYTKFRKIACGKSISMAVSSKGILHTWGTFISAKDNMIGYSPTQQIQPHPRIVNALAKLNIIDIAAGISHCLVLDDNGYVYSWGCGDQSQLGRPLRDEKEGVLPGLITGLTDIVSIACGNFHSFAINRRGHVYAWGLNKFQQCGLTVEDTAELRGPLIDYPTLVPFFNNAQIRVQSISAGQNHSIALMEDNSLVVFGRCDSGQLGIPILEDHDPTRSNSISPKETNKTYVIRYPMKNVWRCEDKIVKVVCGANHNFVLTEKGIAFGFGDSNHYQLGLYTHGIVESPTRLTSVYNKKIIHASAGDQFSLLLATG